MLTYTLSGREVQFSLHLLPFDPSLVLLQARQWAREDGGLKQLAGKVAASLDALVAEGA